jgi:hypothetical protein
LNGIDDHQVRCCLIKLTQPKQVVIGSDNWDSTADCSAIATVTQSDEGITVIVDVTDDIIWTKSETAHKCDSVELYFDVRPAKSRGGSDMWDNVVAACRRCNHWKGDRLLHECSMELMALPYVPNFAEYLALINSGRILGDQMDFLRTQFSRESRLLH